MINMISYTSILFFDFNALNYQDSHFVISRNVYIRIIFDDIFLSTSKLTLFSIEKGWIITDRRIQLRALKNPLIKQQKAKQNPAILISSCKNIINSRHTSWYVYPRSETTKNKHTHFHEYEGYMCDTLVSFRTNTIIPTLCINSVAKLYYIIPHEQPQWQHWLIIIIIIIYCRTIQKNDG